MSHYLEYYDEYIDLNCKRVKYIKLDHSKCNHPDHNPPHIHFPYGKALIHICDGCGNRTKMVRFPSLKQLNDAGMV